MLRKLLSIFLLFFVLINICHSQLPNFEKINFTIDDGLPSNECHEILQDSLGYIWIATDRGLSRFDGYEFKNYGTAEGLEDISCLNIVIDKKQRIWINTITKKIFIYYPELDSIKPYEYNHILKKYSENTRKINYIIEGENNEFLFGVEKFGFLSIDSNGNMKILHPKDTEFNFYTIEIDQEYYASYQKLNADLEFLDLPDFYLDKDGSRNNYLNHKDEKILLKRKSDVRSDLHISKLTNKIFFLAIGGTYFFIEDNKIVKTNRGPLVQDLKTYDDLGVFTAHNSAEGVRYYKDYRDLINDSYIPFLENIPSTEIIRDFQNNFWISSTNNGIYFFQKNQIGKIENQHINNKLIKEIEYDENNHLYIVTGSNEIIQHAIKNNTAKSLHNSLDDIKDFTYSTQFEKLFVGSYDSYYLNEKFKPQYIYGNTDSKSIGYNSGNRIKQKEKYLIKIGTTLQLYNVADKPYKNYEDYLKIKGLRINDIHLIDSLNHLIGTTQGLYTYTDGLIEPYKNYKNIFKTRVNDIQEIKDYISVATLGKGLILLDKSDSIIIINNQNGLLTDNIENVIKKNGNELYICTNFGLSKIRFNQKNFKDYEITNYTTSQGLPSNKVTDVSFVGDSTYIATAKGLCLLYGESISNGVINPIIEKIEVNNQKIDHTLQKALDHSENNLTIHYKTLDLNMRGDITYRYSLNDENLTETKSTFVNFASLSPGDYTFSVSSQNSDAIYSEPVIYRFNIKQPWWTSKWFLIASFLLLGLLLYLFFKNRIAKINERNKIDEEIIELERSALQAQMNPHFIFNCLNSIQNFIMDNDKENAMAYLSKFAKLIRQNLTASVDPKITLDQEISMLDNYLMLEQLRFKNKFDYSLMVAPNIDPISIKIPSLLIQPFVENAVIHGMSNKSEKGFIKVVFTKKDNYLHVTVTDNGYHKENGSKLNPENKSLGMSITSKRLAHINQMKADAYTITPKHTNQETQVNISIRFDS